MLSWRILRYTRLGGGGKSRGKFVSDSISVTTMHTSPSHNTDTTRINNSGRTYTDKTHIQHPFAPSPAHPHLVKLPTHPSSAEVRHLQQQNCRPSSHDMLSTHDTLSYSLLMPVSSLLNQPRKSNRRPNTHTHTHTHTSWSNHTHSTALFCTHPHGHAWSTQHKGAMMHKHTRTLEIGWQCSPVFKC